MNKTKSRAWRRGGRGFDGTCFAAVPSFYIFYYSTIAARRQVEIITDRGEQ